MSAAAEVVIAALAASAARDWEGFARWLHPDVVHRTPGIPEPILGREAFLLMSRQAVGRTPEVMFEVDRLVSEDETVVVVGAWTYLRDGDLVRQPSVSVIDLLDGLIWRDIEYFGLAM